MIGVQSLRRHLPRGRFWLRVGLLGLVVAAAAVFANWILPAELREAEAGRRIAELRERTKMARAAIAEVRDLEHESTLARSRLREMQGDLPPDSPMTWFPQRLKEYFDRCGVAVEITRHIHSRAEPGLPGFQRSYWVSALRLDADHRNLNRLLFAMAELEREDRAVKVVEVDLFPAAEPGQTATLAVSLAALFRE